MTTILNKETEHLLNPSEREAMMLGFNVMPSTEDLERAKLDRNIKLLTSVVQSRLDAFAQSRGYDNILSACTYIGSSVPKFAAEAQTCINLRDATWAACYAILADVNAGLRTLPTVDSTPIELPLLEWPSQEG